ncbi:MAG: hypothetical protein K0Q72_5331 [Armatimonadetes bacterium]|jgi:hypothetical protein|nr:hypothetical protein [Armatimonadota bacterium]
MKEIKCYRIRQGAGWTYRLEAENQPVGDNVVLHCRDEVRVGRSAVGNLLLYADGPYGVHPDQAIQLGWCRLSDTEEADGAAEGEAPVPC